MHETDAASTEAAPSFSRQKTAANAYKARRQFLL
jgi:hypothetical protein